MFLNRGVQTSREETKREESVWGALAVERKPVHTPVGDTMEHSLGCHTKDASPTTANITVSLTLCLSLGSQVEEERVTSITLQFQLGNFL